MTFKIKQYGTNEVNEWGMWKQKMNEGCENKKMNEGCENKIMNEVF